MSGQTFAIRHKLDFAELCKLAGRDVGGASFEGQVLSELQQLRREMRAGFKRLDEAVAALGKRRPWLSGTRPWKFSANAKQT